MAIKPLTHLDELGRFGYLSTYPRRVPVVQDSPIHQRPLVCSTLRASVSKHAPSVLSLSKVSVTRPHITSTSRIYHPRRSRIHAPQIYLESQPDYTRFGNYILTKQLPRAIIVKMVLWQDTVPLLITNNCGDTIWPGIYTTAGTGPGTGGFELAAGANRSLEVGSDWYGRIWGRTNCTSPSEGVLTCTTGSCGQMDCTQASVSRSHDTERLCRRGQRYTTAHSSRSPMANTTVRATHQPH